MSIVSLNANKFELGLRNRGWNDETGLTVWPVAKIYLAIDELGFLLLGWCFSEPSKIDLFNHLGMYTYISQPLKSVVTIQVSMNNKNSVQQLQHL